MEKDLNQPGKPAADREALCRRRGGIKEWNASDEYRRAMLNTLKQLPPGVSNTLQGVDADSGYSSGEEYDRRLVDVLNEENIMRRLATHRIGNSGSTRSMVNLPDQRQSWIEEGGALTFGDATFDPRKIPRMHISFMWRSR